VARLRIRIELSRGGLGVPLHKLSSVIAESQKFFQSLAEDVNIDHHGGEWLLFDFDRESLDFTAEFVGPVTRDQVHAFNAAFGGTTSLRRSTIAQFARIADSIGEDEIIGFGLYQSDEETEPSEWRCLSRRDALRIADEIQLLLGVSGELDQESRLPTVRDPAIGARLFGDRRDRGIEQIRLADYVRELETTLETRITRVENKVDQHTGMIHDLRAQSATTEETFRHLLTSIENFCTQATRQIEHATAAPALPPAPQQVEPPAADVPQPAAVEAHAAQEQVLSAPPSEPEPQPVQPAASADPEPAPALVVSPDEPAIAAETPPPAPQALPAATIGAGPEPEAPRNGLPKWIPLAAALGLVLALAVAGAMLWPRNSATTDETGAQGPKETQAAAQKAPEVAPAPQTTPDRAAVQPASSVRPPAARPKPSPAMRLDIEAKEPTWVSLVDADGNKMLTALLAPGDPRTVELLKAATLRIGNAAGLSVRVDGKALGPIGPQGRVRDIEFKDGTYRITTPQ